MTAVRVFAALLGLSLIVGESIRSYGVGRPPAFWLDDMLMGGFLVAAAWFARRGLPHDRLALAAAWGANAGMLYGSFFGKLFDPGSATAGNIPLGPLTALIGLAFVTAVAGMFATILLPWRAQT